MLCMYCNIYSVATWVQRTMRAVLHTCPSSTSFAVLQTDLLARVRTSKAVASSQLMTLFDTHIIICKFCAHLHARVVMGCTQHVPSCGVIYKHQVCGWTCKVGTVIMQLLIQVQTQHCLCSTPARDLIRIYLPQEWCLVWHGVMQQPMMGVATSAMHTMMWCGAHLATPSGM